MAENTILSLCFPSPTPAQAGPVDKTITNAFQQLCVDIGHSHHCQVLLDVSLNNTPAKKRLSIETHQSVYNVTISGAYQNVILARGALMRNSPLKPKLTIKISKASISADAFSDPGSTPASHAISTATGGSATEDTESVTSGAVGAQIAPSSISSAAKSLASEAATPATDSVNSDTQGDVDTLPTANATSTLTEPAETSLSNHSRPVSSSSIPVLSTTTSFSSYFTVHPQFKAQVDQISASTKTTISLVSSQFHALPSTKSVVAAHARQEMVELHISGSWENAEAARLLLLVTIDALQPGIVQEKLQVELKYQNMIGGRKRQDVQGLMAKTRTNIYMASPFVQTVNKGGSPVDPRFNEIYITGEPAKVQIAKELLARSYTHAQAAAAACTRQVNIASRKLDWMLLNHRDKLRTIMIDNASFIAFPPLGASHPIIFVYSESRVNVERTIRTVMQLSSQFHSGSINLLSPVRDNLLAIPMNPPNALSPIANISKLVSQASGAEVEFRSSGFSIFGNEIQTRIAVQYLSDVDFIKTLHYEVKFSVELANEHREFISGKKNGKINRIMKATGAKIKFDPCNEYNFYVDLKTYHKRIIGVGGKNIQRIMKKYGVYVKFSNSEEFANLGGYFDNLDNVVARTPSKNAMNLDNLKHAVMELVNPKDKDFVHHSLSIPKDHHLALLSDHASALSELRDATNASVRFPEKETGSDIVWISGPEALIQQATSMLLSMVDEQYVYPVPFSEAMDRVLAKPEFKTDIMDRMKNEWNMTLVPPPVREVVAASNNEREHKTALNSDLKQAAADSTTPTTNCHHETSDSPKDSKDVDDENDEKLAKSLSNLTDSDDEGEDNEEEDHLFVFKYSRNNEDYLQNAKELLVQFLIDNQIEVYDDEIRVQRPRSDSFAEAFPHFNSKILSSVAGGELPTQAPAFLNYSLFENAGNAFESLNRAPGSGNVGQVTGVAGASSMVGSDIRALFSHGSSPGLPPLASSPPHWPEQHSRQLTSVSGSSSGINAATAASGPSFAPGHASSTQQQGSHSISYNRLTSLPIDPWASPGKQPQQHQQRQHSRSVSGYSGSLNQFRTPPPGMSNTGAGNSFYTPSVHSQQSQMFSPEGPYGSPMGYQTPVTTSSSHRYSSNNSPVQGGSNNLGNFTGMMGQQSPQHHHHLHHQPSPQRPMSGTSGSRENMQYLDDKIVPGSTFGPGYGPTLNSGSNRGQQHQTIYQQQQSGQAYPPASPFGQSIQYPQQRQRHSSHNSTASHHTMFLGPIGGGLGSTGGSVNSDEISTEDESDEPFDDMRNRHRSYHTHFQQQPFQGGNAGFSAHGSPSVHGNRRGSVPSMGSMYSNQQLYQSGSSQPATPPPNVVRLSNSSSDLYGRKSLVGAMARHSIGQQQPLGALGGPLPGINGTSDSTRNISSLSSGSTFGNNERDLLSSGLGGIIGGGTISHSGHYNTLAPSNYSSHASSSVHTNGSANTSHNESRLSGSMSLMGSSLSASAAPFLAESPLDRPGQHMVGGWDH
ncbi:hypothetical protein BG011_009582 [Mortierella polycephala]|uniref:K Homology domain-containing protein n=1 Tax=Mortierella polycephala TaxID=41804 RepID=A0A9P6U6N9_9FUNG|nr:hypothetical protein BG011_009582 [Mortierella polycephala]